MVEAAKDGTVTTTEKAKDGSSVKTVQNPDGSSKTTVNRADKVASETSVDRRGGGHRFALKQLPGGGKADGVLGPMAVHVRKILAVGGVEWAVAHGISDGSNPERAITREQLAAMLYRCAGSPRALVLVPAADPDVTVCSRNSCPASLRRFTTLSYLSAPAASTASSAH